MGEQNIIILYVNPLVRAAWRTVWRAQARKMSVRRVMQTKYEPNCTLFVVCLSWRAHANGVRQFASMSGLSYSKMMFCLANIHNQQEYI